MRTDTRADSLLAGALVAHLWTRGITVPRRYLGPATWLAAGFLTWCFLRVRTDSFLFSGGFTFVAIAAAIVIFGSVERAWAGTALLESTPLRAVGRVSYGLYLWHFPVFAVVGRYGPTWSPAERVAVAFAVTAALTIASWLLVERHFLRWKDSLEARRRDERKVLAPALAAAD
jgi:peptidoglycan/LPS O-acetylase OafA/YrhL